MTQRNGLAEAFRLLARAMWEVPGVVAKALSDWAERVSNPHKMVALDELADGLQIVCACGWEGTPSPSRSEACWSEFDRHCAEPLSPSSAVTDS